MIIIYKRLFLQIVCSLRGYLLTQAMMIYADCKPIIKKNSSLSWHPVYSSLSTLAEVLQRVGNVPENCIRHKQVRYWAWRGVLTLTTGHSQSAPFTDGSRHTNSLSASSHANWHWFALPSDDWTSATVQLHVLSQQSPPSKAQSNVLYCRTKSLYEGEKIGNVTEKFRKFLRL